MFSENSIYTARGARKPRPYNASGGDPVIPTTPRAHGEASRIAAWVDDHVDVVKKHLRDQNQAKKSNKDIVLASAGHSSSRSHQQTEEDIRASLHRSTKGPEQHRSEFEYTLKFGNSVDAGPKVACSKPESNPTANKHAAPLVSHHEPASGRRERLKQSQQDIFVDNRDLSRHTLTSTHREPLRRPVHLHSESNIPHGDQGLSIRTRIKEVHIVTTADGSRLRVDVPAGSIVEYTRYSAGAHPRGGRGDRDALGDSGR